MLGLHAMNYHCGAFAPDPIYEDVIIVFLIICVLPVMRFYLILGTISRLNVPITWDLLHVIVSSANYVLIFIHNLYATPILI